MKLQSRPKIKKILFLLLSFQTAHAEQTFPPDWWKEVPREKAYSWEVLPQDAKQGEVILSKRTELGIFSNFAESSIVLDGKCFPTVEAFWQMMKYPESNSDERLTWTEKWPWTRDQVASMNGFSAKKAGQFANSLLIEQNQNWVSYQKNKIIFSSSTHGDHYNLIFRALVEKLRQNQDVQDLLLKTKDLILIADHHISSNSPDEWHYDKLWMLIRDQVKNKQLDLVSSEDPHLKTCKSIDLKDIH